VLHAQFTIDDDDGNDDDDDNNDDAKLHQFTVVFLVSLSQLMLLQRFSSSALEILQTVVFRQDAKSRNCKFKKYLCKDIAVEWRQVSNHIFMLYLT